MSFLGKNKKKQKTKNHKLPYLTDYHIIWATIVVQLSMPCSHCFLMVESGRLNAKGDVPWATHTHTYACIWIYMQQYNLDTWITSISSLIFCPTSPWTPRPTCAISSLTTSWSLGWFKYTLCSRLVNLSWASLISLQKYCKCWVQYKHNWDFYQQW